MHKNVCRDLLWHLERNESIRLGKSSPKVSAWLEETDLPKGLTFLLQHSWPQESANIGNLSWLPAKELAEADYQTECMRQKLLLIGYADNGDFLVIDYRTDDCGVGFVTHEEIGDHWHEALKFYQPIARTLATFLYRSVERLYIPVDYYAALAFNRFLADEKKHGEPTGPPNAV